jgi:transcriptional regulator GlxA family with amidase domain
MKTPTSLLLCAFTACVPSAAPSDGKPPSPVTAEEHAATIAALTRPGAPPKPRVALVTSRSGTETTDLLVPYGVLTRSGVAEVVIVSETLEPLDLMPALRVTPQRRFADFTTAADYLIVPAMMDPTDHAAQAFITRQHQLGATIIGVCSGARVLAAAGLLDHRRATSHWADIVDLTHQHPTMTWVRDRRYVADREVMTTTGVSASVPASLALVEAIAGTDAAQATADALGAGSWLETHDSDAFHFTDAEEQAAALNELPGWNKDRVTFSTDDGADEVGLALSADAWSRTFRSRGAATTIDGREVVTAGGLKLSTEPAREADFTAAPGTPALDQNLDRIAQKYGGSTRGFVAVQLEYP